MAVAETSDVPGRERAGVLVQPLGVPDFAGEELLLSSVIVADSVAPLAAPVSPEQQMRRPYAVGATDVVPSGEPCRSATPSWLLPAAAYSRRKAPAASYSTSTSAVSCNA